MTYELAKRLKEIGYPQKINNPPIDHRCPMGGYLLDEKGKCPDCSAVIDVDYYFPPLLDLIIQCGDKFNGLTYFKSIDNYHIGGRTIVIGEIDNSKNWQASGYKHDVSKDWPYVLILTQGDSAEEAVAELWIKLNAK